MSSIVSFDDTEPIREVDAVLKQALRRLRQWRRVAVLTTWIRANRDHEYRYSVLPLVNEIMKYL